MFLSFPQNGRKKQNLDSHIMISSIKSLCLTNHNLGKTTTAEGAQTSKEELITQYQLQFQKENIPQSLKDLKQYSIKVIVQEQNKIQQIQKSCFALREKCYQNEQILEENQINNANTIKQLRKEVMQNKQLLQIEKKRRFLQLEQKKWEINYLEQQLCYARNKLIIAKDFLQRLNRNFKQLKKQNSEQQNRIKNAKSQLMSKINASVTSSTKIYNNTQIQQKIIDPFDDDEDIISQLRQKISQKKAQAYQQTLQFKQYYEKQLSQLQCQLTQRELQSTLHNKENTCQIKLEKQSIDTQKSNNQSDNINLKLDLAEIGIEQLSFQSYCFQKISEDSSKAIQGFSITNILLEYNQINSSKSSMNLSYDSFQQIPKRQNPWLGYAFFGVGFLVGGAVFHILSKRLQQK